MEFDRDRQGSTGDAADTGERSATGDPTTGDPSIPRDQSATGGTERIGPFTSSQGAPTSPGSTSPGSSSTGRPFGTEGSGFGAAGASPGSPGATPEDDTGSRAGSYDRKFTGEEHGMKERIGEKVGEGRERLSGAVDAGRNRVAGQLERLGDRLEERGRGMEEAGGVQQRAGKVALRAGEALDSGAEYIRSREPDEMREDLERSIRDRPLLSIGIAAGAGFLLARLLRD